MARKRTEEAKLRSVANFASILLIVLLSAAYILEMQIDEINVNYNVAGLVIILTLVVVLMIQKDSINKYKMAFNVPFMLFLFYTLLMFLCKWHSSHYLLICILFCAVSCIYSHFVRTLTYVVVTNLIVALLVFLKNDPICGQGVPFIPMVFNWGVCLFAEIVMLLLTRSATTALNKALEHQNSFNDLLATTENFVAMINERNEIVYASKTLSELGNTEDPALVQGRPLIDIFPGRSLKIHAGKMLKEKDDYAGDWEFSLNGQKRYFKASSHGLRGSGGTLISLYDMTHLAERDEIAAMKDSMKIGLFFMDKNYVIQDHYSRYLEEMLSDTRLFGKVFTDLISDSVSANELGAIKDYFGMVLERTYDLDMLDDINPLNELHYVNKETGDKKVFQCAFSTVERDRGEVFILVTVYDITIRVELQQRLAEEESRRQEEMASVFELIQVQPDVFNDFMADAEHEFNTIDKVLKNGALSAHDALVKVYQSVHAVKSNAVILGLNVFGGKVHNLESKIKKLREMEGEVPFNKMLELTMDIEKLSKEKDGFKDIIDKLKTYTSTDPSAEANKKQNTTVMVESLTKAANRAGEDTGKKIKFIANDIDKEALEKGPRRDMKDILMQLIRNSAVHGIETPDIRKKRGKNEIGIIKMSIKMAEDRKSIVLKLQDDGGGLDYNKIAEKAVSKKLIKPEDAKNIDMLTKIIFAPGFSTAETEGVHAGRGIGLNLVRDRLKEIKGTVKLKSEAGKGTLFMMVVPAVPSKN